ncbi:MAG: ankyrin repeat domain-containing protein, partial [Parachlamydiaceae bacterium]
NVLKFLFERNNAFFLDEKAYLPQEIADQFQDEFKEWLTLQFEIYGEELRAFHAKYPEQGLRAYYIDACGEITLPMKNKSFPIGELFTDLALISKKQTTHLLPEVDSLKETKIESIASSELVNLSQLFDQNRTVLLLGRAGIGKSSMCQKIAHDWASGNLWNNRFDLLFWLPLNVLNELPVDDNADQFLTQIALPHLFKQLPGFPSLNIEKKRVLFILDGYDEASEELTKRVESLLTDTLYSFFIASRPGKIHLSVDQTIENMGFSETRVEEYIQKFSECQGAKQNHTLYNLIKENPSLNSIAYVPLLLQMIVSLYDKEGSISNFATLTNLYAKMIDALYEWNLPSDPKKEEKLLALAKIAAVGFKSGKLLISQKMMSHPIDPGLLSTGLLKESEKTQNLYFVHLSFQEYLTALYISRSTPEKQKYFIDRSRYEPRYQLVLSFLAGLMHAQGKADNFFEAFYRKSNTTALLPSYQLESLLRFLNECQGLTAKIPAITNLLDDYAYDTEKSMWNILLDDGYPPLLSAVHHHQINALKWLILNFPDLLEQTTEKDTVLPWEIRTHYYISQGKTKTLPYEGSLYTLLAKNGNLSLLLWLQENYPNAIKQHDKEILYVALHENRPSIFQQLLIFNPNIISEASQPKNQSILFKYAVSANQAILKDLLPYLDVEAAKEFARYAIRRESKAVRHLLNDAKLIPHRQEMVIYAIENKKLDSLKAILKLEPSLISYTDQEGKTLLFLSALQGNVKIVEYILSQPTTLISTLTQEGYTPYHAAAANGNVTTLEILFQTDPTQIAATAHNGWTPLHFAAQQGNLKAAQWLVDKCDNLLNAVDSNDETALDIAHSEKHTELVEWLKSKGGKCQRCTVM